MNYSIRAATTDDYVKVLPLFQEGDVFHREALPQIFRKPVGPSRTEEYYLDILKDENSAIFIAISKEIVVGLIVISMRKSQDIQILVPRTYAYIDDIVVKMENRPRNWASPNETCPAMGNRERNKPTRIERLGLQ